MSGSISIIMLKNQMIKIEYFQLNFMESSGSQVVIIYLPSFNDEDKLREAIASQINSGISQHAIVIKAKGHGITAYVELPQARAQQLCAKKKITILNMSGTVKRFFCSHQIFINKLPKNIDQNDVKDYFSQFGTVLQVEIVNTKHSYQADKPVDMRHCYIQFKEKDSASKIIYHPKRHYIKKQEIKIHKTYDIGENQHTDKKIFLKVEPMCENTEQMQYQLHNLFKQYGQLRQKIRLEESKGSNSGTITFVSVQDGEKAYAKLKQTKIDKYRITLKAHSSELGLFVPGIRINASKQLVVETFESFGKIFDCQLSSRNNYSQNAIIYYSNEDDAKKVLAEYTASKKLSTLFNDKPFITINLTPKDRKDFNDFSRKSKINQGQAQRLAPQFNPMQLQINTQYPVNMNGHMMPQKVVGNNFNPNPRPNFNNANMPPSMNSQMGQPRPLPKEN